MPLLKPSIQNTIHSVVSEVLPSKEKSQGNRAREILNKNDLTVEECAREMRSLLNNASEDSIKLKVIDTALKIHGALEPEKQDPHIQINFTFSEPPPVNILIPR